MRGRQLATLHYQNLRGKSCNTAESSQRCLEINVTYYSLKSQGPPWHPCFFWGFLCLLSGLLCGLAGIRWDHCALPMSSASWHASVWHRLTRLQARPTGASRCVCSASWRGFGTDLPGPPGAAMALDVSWLLCFSLYSVETQMWFSRFNKKLMMDMHDAMMPVNQLRDDFAKFALWHEKDILKELKCIIIAQVCEQEGVCQRCGPAPDHTCCH